MVDEPTVNGWRHPPIIPRHAQRMEIIEYRRLPIPWRVVLQGGLIALAFVLIAVAILIRIMA